MGNVIPGDRSFTTNLTNLGHLLSPDIVQADCMLSGAHSSLLVLPATRNMAFYSFLEQFSSDLLE